MRKGKSNGTDSAEELETLRIFATRLNRVLDLRNYPSIKAQRFAQLSCEFGVSSTAARKWCVGESIPGPALFKKISLKLGASIDWLLGLSDGDPQRTYAGSSQIEVPVYAMRPFDPEHSRNHDESVFVKVSSLYVKSNGKASNEYANRFLLECWIDLRNAHVRKGDLLLVDANVWHLQENGIYIVRTADMTFIRRIVVGLDRSIAFISEDREHEDVVRYEYESILFNESRTFEDPGDGAKVKVIGRVVAEIRKREVRIPGLI